MFVPIVLFADRALACSNISKLGAGEASHVIPPVLPGLATKTCPSVGALLTFRFASSTTSSAITVAPSAVDVTSPELSHIHI